MVYDFIAKNDNVLKALSHVLPPAKLRVALMFDHKLFIVKLDGRKMTKCPLGEKLLLDMRKWFQNVHGPA